MKKLLALGLAAAMTVTGACLLASCNESGNTPGGNTPGGNEQTSIKVGFIALHDENSTYDKNFIDAIEAACEKKGAELVMKTGIPEDNNCYDAAADLADQGCDVVFADSFGHEEYILQAAREFPEVEFCHATGTLAHTAGVANHHNAFAHIYQGSNNYDADGNIKIGYVGAYPYAEVVSGYTSFFLGARSIVEEETDISVSMEVTYTSSWFDETAESEGAKTLISRGAGALPLPAKQPAFPTSPTTAARKLPAPTPSSFPPTSTGSPTLST